MMEIEKNTSLRLLNTFGVDVKADTLVRVSREEELLEALDRFASPVLVLGGGSNVLFRSDIERPVLRNQITGMDVLDRTEEELILQVGGGTDWHFLVEWCLERDLGGLENLSLIPGTVGAAPIQNIGAYGVELAETFVHLEAIDLSTGEKKIFGKEECAFGYRDSVFKNRLKGRYFISRVALRLSRKDHKLRTSYGALQDYFEKRGVDRPNIRDISEAVISIRRSKLPDPGEVGNAGSFFKNPVLSTSRLKELQADHPDLVYYPQSGDRVKIPAAWLIESCGWKGKRLGQVGCYPKQALVVVNWGEARGREILE
ncbi:MAG: UDP-N-acetylmuramate dehydrogenase, partial [Saprospiraceae bacterium]|nr:UDP-N-acetylmuramate dehydrogenase [Saprospiraceae bacterium]